jgi:glycogen phosphorylase
MAKEALYLKIPERIKKIYELAHNIWWSWHPQARDLFRAIDYSLWTSSGHNPVKQLIDLSPEALQSAAEDPIVLNLYDSVIAAFDLEMKSANSWYSTRRIYSLDNSVAYFSMEFALHNSLPIYAGGLGILAGDLCKEASDLGLPFVGIGFMYPQGYFHQKVASDGWQQEIYQQLEFSQAPITPVLSSKGQLHITEINLAGRSVGIGVWLVRVGRVNIYLLDTNLEENTPEDRQLSARLYTADPEIRIQQEIVLGIGGVKVLGELGICPSIWHANEGHSAFMTLERIKKEIDSGNTFEIALQKVRSSTLFTTHTPVASGHDSFSPELMEKYFYNYWPLFGLQKQQFFALGRSDTREDSHFNMTVLAIKTSRNCNAVSRLHELETKNMWNTIWQGLPPDQIPISHVTNGVHVPTWIAVEYVRLFEKYVDTNWLESQDNAELWNRIMDIPDEEIWLLHANLKKRLIEILTERSQDIWSRPEGTPQQVILSGALFNPHVLTIAFARRFAEYKRPALLFHDTERLKKIITNPLRPVQIIFSGKSHPADFTGKYLLHKVYTLSQDRELRGRIAFIEDYDMHIGRYLTHGADAWINLPQRLKEASGTSGMKAGLNGILNISIRDGWWEEGYNVNNGWAVGHGPEAANWPDQDKNDADALYSLIEEKVAPLYYKQGRDGIPHDWVKMVKESMRSIVPRFCASRMLKEYTEKFYIAMATVNQVETPK